MRSGLAFPAVRAAPAVLVALLAGGGVPASARAQGQVLSAIGDEISRRVNASLDLGAAGVTYDDFLRSRVVSITPAVRVEGARTLVLARTSLSQFASGNTSIQGALSGSLVSPEVWGVRGEVYGTGGATEYAHDLAATNVFGAGRVHVAGTATGVWAGAGLGFVTRGSKLPLDVTQADLGGWAREGPLTYTVTVLPTRVGPDRYADATLTARWQGRLGELAVSGGYRARARDSLPGVRAWAEAWATAWLTGRLALVGGAGNFPFDPLQGLPGGRYVSAAVRVAQRRAGVSDPALRAALLLPYEVRRLRSAGARADRFAVADNDDGTRTLRVRVAGARRVELMADFTEWTSVPLTRLPPPAGGGRDQDADAPGTQVWALTVVLTPGVHRVNVRVDGGAWQSPPGLSAVRDEFGGSVGLLVVR